MIEPAARCVPERHRARGGGGQGSERGLRSVEGIHTFTFGGFANAASWANVLLAAAPAPGRAR